MASTTLKVLRKMSFSLHLDGAFGMAVDGEEVSGFDYDGRHSYSLNGALDLSLADVDKFCEKVISNLYPKISYL